MKLPFQLSSLICVLVLTSGCPEAATKNVTENKSPISGGISTPGEKENDKLPNSPMSIDFSFNVSPTVIMSSDEPVFFADITKTPNDAAAMKLTLSTQTPNTADDVSESLGKSKKFILPNDVSSCGTHSFFLQFKDKKGRLTSVSDPRSRKDVTYQCWSSGLMKNNAPAARRHAAAVFTGNTGDPSTSNRMIIWGGVDISSDTSPPALLNTGAIYNPADDSWVPMSLNGAPEAIFNPFYFWTGQTGNPATANRFIFYTTNSYSQTIGGVYDIATDSWSSMSMTGAPKCTSWPLDAAVWTGSKLIAWGSCSQAAVGGVYDLATNTWSAMSTAGAPSHRQNTSAAVWTGQHMVVWGGFGPYGSGHADGAAYDPNTNSWTQLPPPPAAFEGRGWHFMIYSDDKIIVFGGLANGQAQRWPVVEGAMYDLAQGVGSGTWTLMANSGIRNLASRQQLSLTSFSQGVSHGQEAFVTASGKILFYSLVSSDAHGYPIGVFDPNSNSWQLFQENSKAPATYNGANLVWSGNDELYFWGATKIMSSGSIVTSGWKFTLPK